MEVIAIKREPYRLQLAGYLGESGDYSGLFVGPDLTDVIVAKKGHRFESLGVVLKELEVRRLPVVHADAWPSDEVAAVATVWDEATGKEVVLDSRNTQLMPPRAQIRIAGSESELLVAGVGDELRGGDTGYRVERIGINPPEVAIVRLKPDATDNETRILRPAVSASPVAATRQPMALAPLASTGR
jgi:hypothetical protein